ncbi:calcium-binding protein E63-1-like [Centruroides sculpturatus]|uniref:calcium-binding protein E63-1-like n=1 Tax=Centruroides sculpturatus TaxID=218467 RepID=UPI000C6E0A7D|nr:calcium-binding protein E63-1-like [Centruroides sculpturatus]XP_023230810.1 calcium-binding protein E63-1-like [Centruroides sculpturatus]
MENYQLSDNQIQELKAAFSMLDKNQDGRVSATEIKFMLDNFGICLTDSTIQHLIQQASGNNDGLIDESEFLAWMASHQQALMDDETEDLLAAFRVFDRDRNGYITRDELKVAMDLIGEPMSEQQLDDLLELIDVDNDGRINYEEFVKMLL